MKSDRETLDEFIKSMQQAYAINAPKPQRTKRELTKEEKAFAYTVGVLIGQVAAYKIYRKMGASRWQALAIIDVTGRLNSIALRQQGKI